MIAELPCEALERYPKRVEELRQIKQSGLETGLGRD
jgi:hypothetical protein